jgi:long-subunit fatty acid transport protein
MMSEIAGSGNSFDSWQAQVGVTRNLTTEISMNGSVEYRQFELSTQTLNRSGYRFTLGLSYSPTSLPFGR